MRQSLDAPIYLFFRSISVYHVNIHTVLAAFTVLAPARNPLKLAKLALLFTLALKFFAGVRGFTGQATRAL